MARDDDRRACRAARPARRRAAARRRRRAPARSRAGRGRARPRPGGWRPTMLLLTMSRMPAAAASSGRPSGRATRSSMARRARLDVERHLAAEQVRRNAAEHEVGVGDGGLLAAGAVTDRARAAAPALSGPTVSVPSVGDARDRAAARADRVDVDHRHVQRPGADATLRRDLGLARRGSGTRRRWCRRRRRRSGRRTRRPRRRSRAPITPAAGPESAVWMACARHDVGADDAAVRLHDRQRRRDRPARAAARPAGRRSARPAAARRR